MGEGKTIQSEFEQYNTTYKQIIEMKSNSFNLHCNENFFLHTASFSAFFGVY